MFYFIFMTWMEIYLLFNILCFIFNKRKLTFITMCFIIHNYYINDPKPPPHPLRQIVDPQNGCCSITAHFYSLPDFEYVYLKPSIYFTLR